MLKFALYNFTTIKNSLFIVTILGGSQDNLVFKKGVAPKEERHLLSSRHASAKKVKFLPTVHIRSHLRSETL